MIKETLFVFFAFLAITTAYVAKETLGDGVQQVGDDPLKQLVVEVDDFETAESAYGGYNRGHGHYGGHRGGYGHRGGHYGGYGGYQHRGHGYHG
ncbi:hypothetical protein CBL_04447 [Carabus blaptoides fortunei]